MDCIYQICEKFNSEEVIEPGDLIEISPEGKYQRTQNKFSNRIVGVCVSEENIDADPLPDNQFYIAICGRAEVNIVGLCKIGDILVSSDMIGYAMSYDRTKAISGTILAKVVELTEDKNIVIAQLMLS